MPVPLHLVRKWMQNQAPESVQDTGDVEEAATGADGENEGVTGSAEARCVLRWRGKPGSGARNQTRATNDPNDLRPGDVIVIRGQDGGWNDLGHIPGSTTPNGGDTGGPNADAALAVDRAEQGNLIARRRSVLRLRADLLPPPPPTARAEAEPAQADQVWIGPVHDVLQKWNPVEPPDDFFESLKDALASATKPSAGDERRDPAAARARIAYELSRLSVAKLRRAATPHPAADGLILSLPGRITLESAEEPEDADSDGEADELNVDRDRSITLDVHTDSVIQATNRFASCLPSKGQIQAAVTRAAQLHDLGKLDSRWQGMIRAGLPPAQVRNLSPLAKSDAPIRTRAEYEAARRRVELPRGFRHEMLSMQIAEHATCHEGKPLLHDLPAELRDLVLHLIASHHGHARPLAPVVIDEEPVPLPAFELRKADGNGAGPSLQAVDASRRAAWEQVPAHRLDSGVCDRFWTLTRRYGWWGLAYLESILRLADRTASREERENVSAQTTVVTASRPQALVSKGAGR
jgi:CRISPR-associated endonuclease/helicase Cas3